MAPGKNAAAMAKSRNSPAPGASNLPTEVPYDPDYLNTRLMLYEEINNEHVVDQAASNSAVPDSKSIDAIIDKLNQLNSLMEKRSTFYDRSMRYLADQRKRQPDYDRIRADEGETKRSKHKRKKGTDSGTHDGQSSPAKNGKRKASGEVDSTSSPLSSMAPGSPGAMEVDEKEKKEENEEESSSEDEGAPPPRQMPAAQTFGDDPSTFPDPTVYEIRDTYPGMPEDERKEIYSVAVYPPNDLADLIAGDPPDKDFSNAKPSSQINFSTFSTYIEPYFRPFSEEDLSFLRERGDRVTPFVMPKRGKRHYSEIWAEEDGAMALDGPAHDRDKLPPNQPRGNIDNMNDTIAETSGLSIGPLASRLLQAMRPVRRQQNGEEKPQTNGLSNGDISMNGDGEGEDQNGEKASAFAPATQMPESSTEAYKKANHPKLEYAQVDERLKQELRHIGFLPQETFDADYDAHYDDEVAARIRELQSRLRKQMQINSARKALLTDLVRDRMAHQEYQTILEDLDSQVQAAYLKRTRTMGKSKKAKRPGGAGGGSHAVGGAAGVARPGIGDMTKTLMERRRRWIDELGPLFKDDNLGKVPRSSDPNSSIFQGQKMEQLLKEEAEQWDEEAEE